MSQNEEQGLLNHNPLVMNSLGKECQQLKHSYDSCFNAWFSEKFLSGSTDMSQCEPLLQLYTKCVKRVMAEKKIDVGDIENGVRKTTTLPTNL